MDIKIDSNHDNLQTSPTSLEDGEISNSKTVIVEWEYIKSITR